MRPVCENSMAGVSIRPMGALERLRHQLEADHHPSKTVVVTRDELRSALAELTRLRDSLARCEALVAKWREDESCEVLRWADDCADELAAALASRERANKQNKAHPIEVELPTCENCGEAAVANHLPNLPCMRCGHHQGRV